MLTGNSNLLKFIISGDGSELRREVEKSRRTVTGFADQLSEAASGMNASMMMAVRGVQTLLGLQVVGWARSGAAALYEASAAAERLRIGLDFASARGSADEIAYLRKTTDGLGLSFASTAQSYMQFQAAAKGTALEGSKARDVFESVAKASAVMGLSAEQNSGVLLALQQMVSKGTVQAEELRGQLGERLPGAFQIAARSMGVTTAELGKMLEMGQVISDDFLPKFAAELERSLGGAAENAANRLDAAVNRFDNAWERLKQKVGDSGVSKAMASEMTALSRDVITVTETIERASAEGSGALSALSQGALVAAGRAGFSTLNLAANTLNGTINFLTGDLLGLNTKLAILPDALKTNAEQVKTLGVNMDAAQVKLKRLQELDAMPSNGNYYKTAIQDTNAYIDKLREALKLRGALAGDAPNQPLRDREAGNSRGNRTAYNNSLFASQQFLAERDDKVNKAFIADIDGLAKAYATGTLSANDYVAAVNSANQSRYASTEAGKAESKALKDSERDAKGAQGKYQELSTSILQKTEALTLELAIGSRVSESDKLRIKFQQDLQGSLKGLSAAQRVHIADLIAEHEKQERAIKARKEAIKQYEQQLELEKELAEEYVKQSKAREAMRTGVARANQDLEDQEKRMALEVRLIGATTAARETGLAALDAEIELRKELDAINSDLDVDESTRIEARTAAAARAARKIALAQQRVYVTEGEKASQTISQTFQDYIMGGGKDAATYLKRLFSTLVLEPVVKYGVQGVMGMLGMGGANSGTGSDGASSLTGGGMPGGSFTDWSTLGSKAGNWLIDQSTDLAVKGFGSLSKTAFSLGDTIKGVDTWLKDIPGMSGGIGSALGYAGALYSLTQGQYGSAAGAAIGTAILPGIGTMIGSTLGGLVDGLFGSNPKEHTGGVYSNATDDRGSVLDALNLTKHARGDFTKRQNEGVDTALATTIDGLLESYAGFAKRATGDVRELSVYAAFATNPISKDEDAYGYMRVIDRLTGEVVGRASRRDGDGLGNDPEKAYGLFTGEIAGVLVKELKAADLPGWMHSVFDSLGESVTLESYSAAVQQIALIDAGFLSLGKTMGMFADLSGDMQTALLAAAGSMEALSSVAGSYYQSSLFTEHERMLKQREQQMQALSSMGLYIDPAEGHKAKALFKATVEEAMRSGQGALAVSLMAMSASFAQTADYAAKLFEDMQEQARDAALSVAESNLDGAGRNFEAAIDRERSYWQDIADSSQKAISALTGTLGLLSSNARDLYGTVDSTQQMLAAQGMVYIEDALSGVLAGTSLNGFNGLQDAITAARGGISGGVYATDFERQRDTLVLAGQLSELGALGDAQLSIEERSLKAAQEQITQLDETLAYWQQQIDGTGLLIDGQLSVAASIDALSAAIMARDALQKAASGGGGGGGSSGGGAAETNLNRHLKIIGAAWAAGDRITAQNHVSGQGITNAQLQAAFDLNHADLMYLFNRGVTGQHPGQYSFTADSAEGMYAEAKAQGLTLADVDKIVGANPGDAQAWAKANGLPTFATGGLHAGGLRVVGERGWEMEATGPARIWNQQQLGQALGGGSNAELVAQNQALQAKVERLEAQLVRVANATERLADQFNNATAGGNAMAVEVMT